MRGLRARRSARQRAWVAACLAIGLVVACNPLIGIDDLSFVAGPDGGTADGGTGDGGTGGAGEVPECMADDDCVSSTPCLIGKCASGKCVKEDVKDGTPVVSVGAVEGDCKKEVCIGGKIEVQTDDSDLGEDGNPCTMEACVAGEKMSDFAPNGTVCGNGLFCDNGICQGCNGDPTKCDPPGECYKYECPADSCVKTILVNQVIDPTAPNDCKVVACNASGNKETKGDPNETPPQDGFICDVEQCDTQGGTDHQPANEGQMCAASQGVCFNNSVCASGSCAAQPKPAGTKVGDDGVVGNCKGNFCDGNGGFVSAPDDADVPNPDPNPQDCHVPACNTGVPTTAPKSDGTKCGGGNLLQCCDGICCGQGEKCAQEPHVCCHFMQMCYGTVTKCCFTGESCDNDTGQCF
jgi:hypothetical protein